jgi:hypothetical protein
MWASRPLCSAANDDTNGWVSHTPKPCGVSQGKKNHMTALTTFSHHKPKSSNNLLPHTPPQRGCYTKPFLTLSNFPHPQPKSSSISSPLRGHTKSRRPFDFASPVGHTVHHAGGATEQTTPQRGTSARGAAGASGARMQQALLARSAQGSRMRRSCGVLSDAAWREHGAVPR